MNEYGYHPAVALALAEMFDQDGDVDRAEQLYKNLLEAAPEEGVYLRLVDFYWNRKQDRDAAIKLAEEFLQQENFGMSHARLTKEIAYELLSEGKETEALAWAERATGLYSGWGLMALADCNERQRNLERALEYLTKLDEEHGTNGRYYFAVRTGHGDLDDAYEELKASLARWYQPEDPSYQSAVAVHALAKGDLTEALAAFRKVADHPDYDWYALWIAAVADRKGDLELRKSQWKRLLEIDLTKKDPEHIENWKRLQSLTRLLVQASESGTLKAEEVRKVSGSPGSQEYVLAVPFFAACWLEARDSKVQAIEFYREVARMPAREDPLVIIAWQRLRELGEDPLKLIPRYNGLTEYVRRNLPPKP
jgi:tetratricopeptide (TPR) repeat protein